MKHLVDDCFSTLFRLTSDKAESVCKKWKDNDTTMKNQVAQIRHRAFKLGIDYILHSWDDKIKDEECSSALQRFPSIEKEYAHCIHKYCDIMNAQAEVRGYRTFGRFLYNYICAIASSREMSDMLYFDSFNFADKDIFLKEVFRTTLMNSVHFVDTDSQENKNRNSSVLTASTHMSHTAAAAARSAEQIMSQSSFLSPSTTEPARDAVGSTTSSRSTESASLSITPDDSVSNIHSHHTRASSTTILPRGDTNILCNKRALTRSLLDIHDKRLTNQSTTAIRIGAPLPNTDIKNITIL